MNRWWVVAGGILIQYCLGAIYAWSVFTPELEKSGWSKLQTQIVFALGLLSFAVVMVWAGKKLQTWGPRKLAMIGGIVLGSGYALAGLFGGTSFWLLVLLIGLIGGAGIGMAYVVPIAVSIRWFPDKKGLITGLAVAGFGFGALIWIKLAGAWGHLIDTWGLSYTWTFYGILFAVLVIIGSLWMVFPPKGWKPEEYDPAKDDSQTVSPGESLASREMIRTRQFFIIGLTFIFSAGAGLMSIGLMKLYPIEALERSGYSTAVASSIAGSAMAIFFSIANGLGRIVWGSISDVLGRRRSLVTMSALQGIMMIAFIFLARQPILLYVGAAIVGFNFGGNFSLFPTMTADTFGSRHIGQNYPYVFLAYGIGGTFGPLLGGVLGDMGNFPMAFAICGILCLAGAVLISRIKPVQHIK
jgi:OFA family oxalate/formate antiporter-like MFS transporter